MLPFVPGTTYRRRDIHDLIGGQKRGGISTPSRHPLILLFTGEQGEQYGYEDGFKGDDVYWYTGEGQVGDMKMIRGNRAIYTHQKAGKELHLFQDLNDGRVKHIGPATYISHHYSPAPDRNKNLRQAIVFVLAIGAPSEGVPDLAPDDVPSGAQWLWKKPMTELKEAAFAQKPIVRHMGERKTKTYFRSEVVKVYVLRRAGDQCEGCDGPAPFRTLKGNPYLEPHHIRRRADNGPDHPRWVIALCPNCHKRVHYGADGHEYNLQLADRVAEIENIGFAGALL